MANRVYAVLFHVRENNLGTVLSALSSSSDLVSVTPTETIKTDNDGKRNPPKNFKYANGKRFKGISGEALALEILQSEQRIFTGPEIKNAFVARGFAGNSCWGTLSKLASEKKVRSLGNGKFCMPGTVVHPGA